MNRNNLIEDIITYLHNKSGGVSSRELAEVFLKFQSPDTTLAHRTIKEILKNDIRCTYKNDSLWHADTAIRHSDSDSIRGVPWAAAYLLSNPHGTPHTVLHISIWSLFETPECIASEWLIDPKSLPHNEQETLLNNNDSQFVNMQTALARTIKALDNRAILFVSYKQQRNFTRLAANAGLSITDDIMLISQLFQLNDIRMSKPINPETCYRQLFNTGPDILSASHYGKIFSACARKLLLSLIHKGINSRGQLEQQIQTRTLLSTWENARFSLSDILRLPQGPGVYGFMNAQGSYIYIGKAKNLRQRLQSYFRNTEESPEKLGKLREQAHTFTTHECGSELESLILEYRLIKKHAPSLNAKVYVNERKGYYRPLHDCIILLPHVKPDTCMSCWFRENQKSRLKPLPRALPEKEAILTELDHFFFSDTLPAQPSDFPEQEIIFRWVKNNEDTLPIIPVYRMSSPEDIFLAVKSSLRTMSLRE